MVQYIYQKYNAQLNSGSYFLSQTGQSNSANATALGWTDYSFNTTTGVVSTAGTFIDTSSGSVYVVNSNVLTQKTVTGGQTALTTFESFYSGDYYTQGSLIGQVIAEDGTYPTNGRHTDGFWYVRRVDATSPTLISPNGGELVNESVLVQWTNARTGLKTRIDVSFNNGSTWSTVATTAIDATSYLYDTLTLAESNIAKIRVTHIDGTLLTISDESNGVFTIRHNIAPLAPTLIEPVGTKVNALNVTRFTWQHNDADAQSKAEIRVREQGYIDWETFTVIGSQAEVFAALDYGVAPTTMEWQVRTYDQQGLVSPWSQISVFEYLNPTADPVITSPIATVTNSRPVIQWTSPGQVAYQIVITDMDNIVLWDTGEISGGISGTIKSRTSGIDFVNGASYRINVRTKDVNGIFSDYVQETVITAYTPPAKPILNAYKAEAAIQLVVTNPTPTGTQPVVVGNDIYKVIDGVHVRIAANVNATYTDYAVADGVEYTYIAVAIGDTDVFSTSDLVTQSVTFKGAYIHDPLDAESTVYHYVYNGTGVETEFTPESAVLKFAGRKRPVVHFGTYAEYTVNVVLQASRDMTPMIRLRQFVNNRTPICYRDDNGEFLYGFIQTLPISKEYRVAGAEITIIETDYDVEV